MNMARPTKLLVVDDSATTRFLIKRGLEGSGDYDVLAMYASGEDLLRELDRHDPDAIYMDIRLSGELDGIETAKRIQEQCKIPIIFSSFDDSRETLERAMQVASYSFVLKPLSIRELRITIDFAVFQARTERELRSRDMLLSQILESVATSVIYLDPDARISYFNQAARSLTVFDNTTIGRKIDDCLRFYDPRTTAPRRLPICPEKSDTDACERSELAFRDRDGREHIVSWTLNPFREQTDKAGGWILNLHDRTDEFRIRSQLVTAFHALENIEEGVVVTKPFADIEEIDVLFCNDAFQNICECFVPAGDSTPDIAESRLSACKELFICAAEHLAQGERFETEFSVEKESGPRRSAIWTSFAVNAGDDLLFWLHTVTDTTQIRELEANFRESQKLEAVGQLAGGIAHDFNNILSIINSYADLLQINFDENHPYFTYAKNIADSGRKGAALVAQLMSFSRRQDSTVRSVINLVDAVRDIEDMLNRLIRESVLVDFEYHCDTAPLLAAENMVEQILINLLVNAQDAIEDTGRITVSIRIVECETPPIGLGADDLAPGSFVCLTVRDDGSGIPGEIQERIFEPFFTTKDVGKGTGLGLSTVFGLVSDAKGVVQLESRVGHGSAFHLYFPSTAGAEGSSPAALNAANRTGHEEPASYAREAEDRVRILVAEDDEQFSECIEGLLELHGFEVYRASNGREMLEFGEDVLRSADLLISDLVMPHLSGMALAREVLQVNPEIKLIFMTGYSDTMPNPAEYPHDMVLLRKPFSISLIIDHIGKLLGVQTGI